MYAILELRYGSNIYDTARATQSTTNDDGRSSRNIILFVVLSFGIKIVVEIYFMESVTNQPLVGANVESIYSICYVLFRNPFQISKTKPLDFYIFN